MREQPVFQFTYRTGTGRIGWFMHDRPEVPAYVTREILSGPFPCNAAARDLLTFA